MSQMLRVGQRYFHPQWKALVTVDAITEGLVYYHWTDTMQRGNSNITIFYDWIKIDEMILAASPSKIWKELNE